MTSQYRVPRLHKTGRRLALLVALLFAFSSLVPQAVPGVNAADTESIGRFYPQTQKTLAPQFTAYYDSHGGLALFGYPITDATVENGFLVQWTERERLEWHPENAGTPFEVELGLLGSELTHGLNGPRFTSEPEPEAPDAPASSTAYFAPTGQTVSEPFLSYWRENGGLGVFGYPVSSRFSEDGKLDVQWFERARFEFHPELPEPFRVSLGLVGVEGLENRALPQYEARVGATAAQDAPLQVGLSQGGESADPSFFDNVVQKGNALGPGLVRLDNVYNFYHVVARNQAGAVTYNWTELDRVIDSIRAMGKEPFLCLSYMPEVISASGTSSIQAPADFTAWADLVRATVVHLNIERKLHVRYFEVWNEPNQWDFWQSTFDDYLRLYDVTVQAATGVDPSVQVGGPAFSSYEPIGLGHFLFHEATTPGGRVDFISWHAYGMTPDQIGEQIRGVRSLIAQFPALHPQLFITEFNTLQGGAGDTSAGGVTDKAQGAIDMLRSIESMNRERLDRAFLFELKDGKGPQDYWGRWGILTNSGQPKPMYYALQSYLERPPGMLPVTVTRGPLDGTIGSMAFGGSDASTIFLWYTGDTPARIKLRVPDGFASNGYQTVLFDSTHNNPAKQGDSSLQEGQSLSSGDLVFSMEPNSLVILTSK